MTYLLVFTNVPNCPVLGVNVLSCCLKFEWTNLVQYLGHFLIIAHNALKKKCYNDTRLLRTLIISAIYSMIHSSYVHKHIQVNYYIIGT